MCERGELFISVVPPALTWALFCLFVLSFPQCFTIFCLLISRSTLVLSLVACFLIKERKWVNPDGEERRKNREEQKKKIEKSHNWDIFYEDKDLFSAKMKQRSSIYLSPQEVWG